MQGWHQFCRKNSARENQSARHIVRGIAEGASDTTDTRRVETLRQKGYGQSILSAREQTELITETLDLGVNAYFTKVYGLADHYAHGKTDVGKKLIRDLGLPFSSLLFIGDTRHDAEVANEIGIDCILIPNGHHSEERLRACRFPVIPGLNDLIAGL